MSEHDNEQPLHPQQTAHSPVRHRSTSRIGFQFFNLNTLLIIVGILGGVFGLVEGIGHLGSEYIHGEDKVDKRIDIGAASTNAKLDNLQLIFTAKLDSVQRSVSDLATTVNNNKLDAQHGVDESRAEVRLLGIQVTTLSNNLSRLEGRMDRETKGDRK